MAKDDKAAAAKGGAGEAGKKPGGKGRRKRRLLLLAALLLVAAAASWYLLLGPGSTAEAVEEEPPPELGEVLAVPSISINLADGHYLKLGLGLQTIAEVEHAPDCSLALDAAISLYSGRSMQELSDPVRRDAIKEELKHTVEERYHHEVVDVYFTEYVMQ